MKKINTFLDNFAAQLDRAMGLDGTCRMQVSDVLASLPADLPVSQVMESFTVPETDSRLGLQGQQGVRVRPDAPRGLKTGDFVAVYRGQARLSESEHGRTVGKSSAAAVAAAFSCITDTVVAAAIAAGAEDPAAAAKINLNAIKESAVASCIAGLKEEIRGESYAANAEIFSFTKEAEQYGVVLPPGTALTPSDRLLMAAHDLGNLGSRINDPRLDPFGNSNAQKLQDNVCVCEVHIGAWPFLVMFAFRDIGPGEELLYDYGSGFWELVRFRSEVVAGAEEHLDGMRSGRAQVQDPVPENAASNAGGDHASPAQAQHSTPALPAAPIPYGDAYEAVSGLHYYDDDDMNERSPQEALEGSSLGDGGGGDGDICNAEEAGEAAVEEVDEAAAEEPEELVEHGDDDDGDESGSREVSGAADAGAAGDAGTPEAAVHQARTALVQARKIAESSLSDLKSCEDKVKEMEAELHNPHPTSPPPTTVRRRLESCKNELRLAQIVHDMQQRTVKKTQRALEAALAGAAPSPPTEDAGPSEEASLKRAAAELPGSGRNKLAKMGSRLHGPRDGSNHPALQEPNVIDLTMDED